MNPRIVKQEIKREALEKISSVAELNKDTPFKFKFFNDPKIEGEEEKKDGHINVDIDSKLRKLELNVAKLKENDYDFPSFVNAMVVIFHECRHLEQYYEFQRDCGDIGSLVEYCSKQNNHSYYEDLDNYLVNMNEVDAEASGVVETYLYLLKNQERLQKMFGIEYDPQEAMLKFVKDKREIAKDRRYIGKGFEDCHSVKEISEKFHEYYKACAELPRTIRTPMETLGTCKDILCDLVLKDDYDRGFIQDLFKDLTTGIEQLKFIAAYVLYKNPEYKLFFKNKTIRQLDFEAYITVYEKFYMTTNQGDSDRGKTLVNLIEKQAAANRKEPPQKQSFSYTMP